MALFSRRRDAVDDENTVDDGRSRRRDTVDDVNTVDDGRSRGRGRNTWRGLMTLIGAAVAGLLIWLAHYLNMNGTRGFWGGMGLIAAAGFVLGLSQLFGGWTKFGLPKISTAVLLLGWLPTAIAVGWIGLALQPKHGWQEGRLDSWSSSLGIGGLVHDFAPFLPALALGFGVVTAFILDTTGPRRRRVDVHRAPATNVPDEDVHDYRREDVHDYRREDDSTTVRPGATTTAGTTTGRTTDTIGDDDRAGVDDRAYERGNDEATGVRPGATTTTGTTTDSTTDDDRVAVHDPSTRRY